jgi:sRNA-binding carbon storage regulator CsrA
MCRGSQIYNSQIIRVGKKDEVVTLFEAHGNWVKIGREAPEGWVSGELIAR